jgi:hypothetical protein
LEIISSHAQPPKRAEMTLEHQHLFILCSHSSGSTALWRLLQTSPHVSALPQEGQFTGEVAALMRKAPWNEKTELPWATIKAEWDKVWDLGKPILLEKSPPHLLRAQAIEQAFVNASFIVMVRNPYAYCEGTRRRHRTGLGYGRDASYAQIAEGWVRETQRQINNLQDLQRVMGFTYEELTNRPAKTAAKVLAFMPELETLDHQATFMIHSLSGWLERPLTNLNTRQIARLSAADVAEINSVLQYHPAVMAHFGYDFMVKAFSPTVRAQITLSTFFSKYVTRTMQRLTRRATNRGPNLP